MKIRALFRKCRQIGPEDWEMDTRVMDLDEDATVGDILSWYKRLIGKSEIRDFSQITLTLDPDV